MTIDLRVIHTTDVHGTFFPFDFINRRDADGSLARVATYIESLRREYGDRLLLLDGGDILQGQPTCYFSNFVEPHRENLAAKVTNYMHYDAVAFGNHDVETGHAVYDKWITEVECPVLGANIIDTRTNEPYVRPYTILERQGIRIAILGLLTPAIPHWLNEELWKGLRFDAMVASARHWMQVIRQQEQPNLVIGLFHSGAEGGITTAEYSENDSLRVAREVPGFDLVLFGHDHHRFSGTVTNTEGQSVLCLDPSCNALMISDVLVRLDIRQGKVAGKHIDGSVVNIAHLPESPEFMEHFQSDISDIQAYVDRPLGESDSYMYTRDSYFGNSAFSDFIHRLQLSITHADISFNAPLTFDTCIPHGTIHMSDMFNLYRYENQLYVLRLTGEEVRRHLELSYDRWICTMHSPSDPLMKMERHWLSGAKRWIYLFSNLAFNFDSAMGIDYEVDVRRPFGERIRILRMSDGRPFSPTATYRVAMHSYRGNGGGELLTLGAGIPHDELKNRREWQSDCDQRHYLTHEILRQGTIHPRPAHNWRFVPEEWTRPAILRDRRLLFGE